ncbi:uncharacterized protein LOC121649452 [Melanotaenia boesemani]|uniref:uncharacterized protein LOC121649452 n=1 Tax=Melanotaenia boesemani TaxID=1250792 RepID=UPI001C04FC29|nr:uncharacterized protein LOC121649452 [Melanotaenia boesemani]XP_041856243.1 uncharacterized protein LOC121649452 [Melanotaenia boesemani]
MLQSRTQLVVFLLVAIGGNSAKSVDYKEESKEAVLSPSPVTDPITSVTWKYYSDIALDWYGDQTVCYRQFRDRCKLNKTTGELTIINLYKNDSGTYTPEINNIILQTTEILVISPVPTPTVTTRCNGEKTRCLLTCEGNIAGAEPVSYVWMSDHTSLPSSTKELNITKEETKDSISCMLRNPVSNRSCEILNPFKEINNRAYIGIVLPITLILVLVLVICVIIFGEKVKSREVQTALMKTLEPEEAEEKSLLPSQDSLPIASFSGDVEKGVENGNEERGDQDVPPEELTCKPSENDTDKNEDEEVKITSAEEAEDKDSAESGIASSAVQVASQSPDGNTDNAQPGGDKCLCKYDGRCNKISHDHRRKFRHTVDPVVWLAVRLGNDQKNVMLKEPSLPIFLNAVHEKFKVPEQTEMKVFDCKMTELDDNDCFERLVDNRPCGIFTVKYNTGPTKSSCTMS